MSWLFSRALVAEYLAGVCSDGGQSAQSSTTPTPQAYLSRDKTTAAWRRFPSGMTCEPLTGEHGEELLMSFRAAFRAKTLAQPEKERESTANGRGYGVKCRELLAKYDRDLRSWKTRQFSLHGGLIEFSETFPRWGMTRDGGLFRLPTPFGLEEIRAHITSAKESGSSAPKIPTPIRDDAQHRTNQAQLRRQTIKLSVMAAHGLIPPSAVMQLPTLNGLSSNQRHGSSECDKAVRQLATPTATDGAKWNAKTKDQRKAQGSSVRICNEDRGDGHTIGGKLNPQWVEWLMGWPIGWTDLEPLAMDKFRTWRS